MQKCVEIKRFRACASDLLTNVLKNRAGKCKSAQVGGLNEIFD